MSLIDEARLLLLEYGIDECHVNSNDLKFCKHEKNDENYSYAYLYYHIMNGKIPGYLFVKLLQNANTSTSVAYLDYLSQNNDECFGLIGIAKNQCELGILYLNGETQNYTKAFKLLTLSAKYGNIDAKYYLGICYLNGFGIEKNETKAFKLFMSNNTPLAQHKLGQCYDYGKGVAQDSKKAVEYYIKSANQNNADAQYELGYCYQFGNGVEINREQSNKYYRLHLRSFTKAKI